MKVLVLGVSGMLGNAVFRTFADSPTVEVTGTARGTSVRDAFAPQLGARIVSGIDVDNIDSLTELFGNVKPDVVINCIGLIKQLADANDPLVALPINALLPHRLARLCKMVGARLVHVSTDCVFAGTKGNYKESDPSDAMDLYGRSKFLGEVDYPHAITLRTSIIGRELHSKNALIGWFLSQEGPVKGFARAIFSGLPTVELAEVIRDRVLPNPQLHGLYHVAAAPISKLELLRLVGAAYGKRTEIVPEHDFVLDRSLDASRFAQATGYVAPAWPALVQKMVSFH